MKHFIHTFFLAIFISIFSVVNAQTYTFPVVVSDPFCTYEFEIAIIMRLDSVKITNIYDDNGTSGSFAYEAYFSYQNEFTNSTLTGDPANFWTFNLTVTSSNPNIASPTLTNNASNIPLVTNAAGGLASSNNPTYNGSASALGLVVGQAYSSPQLLSQLGYLSASLIISLPCLSTTITTTATDPLLPVVWSGIEADVNGRDVTLSWRTFAEVNNRGFIIEKSNDAKKWNRVGTLASQSETGNASMSYRYNYSFSEDATGKYYYRVIQQDFDGTETTSNIVSAFVENTDPQLELMAYPNPVATELFVDNIKPDTPYTIIDNSGKQVLSGQYRNSVDVSGLLPGTYLFRSANQILRVLRIGKN